MYEYMRSRLSLKYKVSHRIGNNLLHNHLPNEITLITAVIPLSSSLSLSSSVVVVVVVVEADILRL